MFKQFKQRRVVQWMLGYVAGAWVVLQLVDILGDKWGWPASLQRGIDVVLVAGFLVTLVIAWFHGEKGRQKTTWREGLLLVAIAAAASVVLFQLYGRIGTDDISATGTGSLEQTDTAPGTTTPLPLSAIAVLPCANRTGQQDNDYFVDGVHAELIDELASLGGLSVRARRSVMSFGSDDQALSEVSGALSVGTVLACEVLAAGDVVRIRLELLQIVPEQLLWSESYDRQTADVLMVYSEVAREVAAAVSVVLSPLESQRLAQTKTINSEAYGHYLRGVHLVFNGGSRSHVDLGLEQLLSSISIDPGFAPAWASLSITYHIYHDSHAVLTPALEEIISTRIPEHGEILAAHVDNPGGWQALTELVRDSASRALELNSNSYSAWLAMGNVHKNLDFDFAAGLRDFEKARAIGPNHEAAISQLAYTQRELGNCVTSHDNFERALQIDPLSVSLQIQNIVSDYYLGGWEESIAELYTLANDNPERAEPLWVLSLLLILQGNFQESNAALQRQIPLMGDDSYADELGVMAYNHARMGDRDAAYQAMQDMAVLEAEGVIISPLVKAFPLVGLGDFDGAFEYLNKAIEQLDPWLSSLLLWPPLIPLQGDSRILEMQELVGLGGVKSSTCQLGPPTTF